jgi:putative ABC transport system substrate-binding protein
MIQRREFITLLGGAAAAWPVAAGAQQPAMPVVGILNGVSFESSALRTTAIRQGLKEEGFVEGQNMAFEYRSAEGQYDRLPSLAADLVRRQVAVIVAIGAVPSVFAAKQATTTIPIVFALGSDPVQLGLVASLNRPGGNVTGVTARGRELLAKRLEILRELIPGATAIGMLVNPQNPNTEPSVTELQTLAQAGGWTLHVAAIATVPDLDRAFTSFAQLSVGGFLHATDALFNTRPEQIVALADRYALPGIYTAREAVVGGGLMSYGPHSSDAYRLVGDYAGRILKGEKPADLPVQQATRLEFFLNLKTARALGLDVPTSILLRADQVIE